MDINNQIGNYFTPDIIEMVREEIQGNAFNGVLFIGNVNREGKVYEVEALAYSEKDYFPDVNLNSLQGDVIIFNHPTAGDPEAGLNPSEIENSVASILEEKNIGFYIIDPYLKVINIVLDHPERYYLEENAVRNIFKAGGLLSENIAFEPRQEQISLVDAIIEAVNDSRILVSEAGTGTGKSLSYLIPAAIWAIENQKRVIVSTQTINLQQQIAEKDMKIVEKVVETFLGKNVNYAVLIGRGNYLCWHKLYDLSNDKDRQATLFEESDRTGLIKDIEKWSRSSAEGIRTELGMNIPSDLWEELCSDSSSCTNRKCEYYEGCFYFKARQKAEQSNLIIANHSLVISAINQETGEIALPLFGGIIFDEAHHLEDVTLKSLAKEVSIISMIYQFRKLYSEGHGKRTGLLAFLKKKGNIAAHQELNFEFQTLIDMHRAIVEALAGFLPFAQNILDKWKQDSAYISIDDEFKNHPDFKSISGELGNIMLQVSDYTAQYSSMTPKLKEAATRSSVLGIIQSIGFKMEKLSGLIDIYSLIFNSANEITSVKWAESSPKNVNFHFNPLEIGTFLSNTIFSKKDFSIFTSATLMINNQFRYFIAGIGLAAAKKKQRIEIRLNSPFDYSRQAKIYVLNDDLDHGSVTDEKVSIIRELSRLSGGGVRRSSLHIQGLSRFTAF